MVVERGTPHHSYSPFPILSGLWTTNESVATKETTPLTTFNVKASRIRQHTPPRDWRKWGSDISVGPRRVGVKV